MRRLQGDARLQPGRAYDVWTKRSCCTISWPVRYGTSCAQYAGEPAKSSIKALKK